LNSLKHGEDIMQSNEAERPRRFSRRQFVAALAISALALTATLGSSTPAEAGGKKPRRPLGQRVRRKAASAVRLTVAPAAGNTPGAVFERTTSVAWGGCNGCGQ
jgi:hypothetical protein